MAANAHADHTASNWLSAAAAADPPPVQPSLPVPASEEEEDASAASAAPLAGSEGTAAQGYGVMTARVIDAVALAPPARSSGPQALRDHCRPAAAPSATAAPTMLSVSAALAQWTQPDTAEAELAQPTRPETKYTVLSAWVSPQAELLRGAANHAANLLAQSERDLLSRRRRH